MGKREDYEAKTEKLIMPIVEANNVELFDVDYIKEGQDWYLRVYIDKEGGVTIDDCQAVSRAFNEILDKENYITDQYIFEVSRTTLLSHFLGVFHLKPFQRLPLCLISDALLRCPG